MKFGSIKIHSHWTVIATLILLGGSQSTVAAPGAIGDKPLILETMSVQPNIYFLVDDSGSMNWEDLLNAGTKYPAESIKGSLDFTPDNNEERRLLCRGFNVMAYDPTVNYSPWTGVDSAGNSYKNLTLTTARPNPYSTSTTDISTHVYVKWTDSDSDGEYDGPGRTDTNAAASASDECDISNLIKVSSLSTAEQQNYANWYSYYRKREYVAKRALSQIIFDSTARIGLGSLHNHNSIRTPVKDIDDITSPIDATAKSNKTSLLKNLFNIDSSNGTPLRRSLESVGEYFRGNLNDTWGASPILSADDGGECQKNFAVVMSDGFWNGSDPSVGNTDKDGDGPWDGASYADIYSKTLADVAMEYYENDLNTTLDNRVAIIPGVDENTAQHLVTYTVAFGVNGTLTADPPNRTDAFNWPKPVANEPETIDDMRHAAWNGRGKFLSARDPQQLISSLSQAIKDIDARSGSSAAAALNTTSLQAGSMIFMASYNSVGWHGNLSAINIDTNGVLGSLAWEAGAKLNDIPQDQLLSQRKLFTYNGTDTLAFNVANITDNQKADLLVNKSDAEDESTYLGRIVKFFYGDHTDEAGGSGEQDFRNRNNQRLGDIVHSAPVFVGVPNTPYPNALEGVSNPYSTFASDQSSRVGTVFVGSNDGMLHAFNAATGVERFAYIPNLMFTPTAGRGLHSLASKVYDHRYYVDLTPTVADVFVNDAWRTYLIGGLRGGGKGVFILDVTTEGSMTVKNEFTHVDLGYTFSEIQVAKMNNGKWAAVFGNGYNNSGDGKAKLFILYLDGSGSKIIDTGVGSISSNNCSDAGSDCNGLSTPVLADLNGDGQVDKVYAGDVHGNMWAFNVGDSTDTNWDLSYGSSLPLFVACRSASSPCPAADRQPITSKPALARHPTQRTAATAPNLMVMFGTGQFLHSNDITDTASQSFYGIWDRGDTELARSDLKAQTITQTLSVDGIPIRISTDNSVTYTSDLITTDHGWYIDLPTSKERVVVNPVVYGDLVFFNTMIPETPKLCDSSGGSGWLMAVDINNGGQPDFAPLDVNNDNLFDARDGDIQKIYAVGTQIDGIPTESRFVSQKRITVDSNKKVNVQSVQGKPPGAPSRMSWTGL